MSEEIRMPEPGGAAVPEDAGDARTHGGRRDRVRERFMQEGLDSFAPHEVLELLLYYACPRRDTNPLAHRLLETFGSLKGVLEAEPRQLCAVEGMSEGAAVLLSMIVPLFRRYSLCLAEEKPFIRSTEEARRYCLALLSGRRTEHFYVICLGANRRVLGWRRIAEGTVTEVAAYPRRIAETALNLGAQGVILCHNHPEGVCEPSPEDVALTHRLFSLLEALDIRLLDHVITAGGEACSMAERGELTPVRRKRS